LKSALRPWRGKADPSPCRKTAGIPFAKKYFLRQGKQGRRDDKVSAVYSGD